ncbi:MAG: DNA polymerase III subunit beta [Nannocystaceae bacterium]
MYSSRALGPLMEFEIEQPKFSSALALAQTVADKRGTMPVLANVLLRADDSGQVICSSTDMMISLTETIPATVKKAGSLSLGVHHLYGIVRTLSNRAITIQGLDNHWARLAVGRSEFKLMGMAELDFPELPKTEGHAFTKIPSHQLIDLIQKTQFSVSTDEARVNLNGVLFESDGTYATMVSTDGHRLTKLTVPFAGPKLEKGIIIPRKGMIEIKRVLDRAEGDVELAVGPDHLFIKADRLTLSVKLNNVTFPPYQQVIPKEHKLEATALREELINALKTAAVMAPEKTATVRVQLEENNLKLTADNPDLGVAHQEVEVDFQGKGLTAGFNARYLIEVLEAISSAQVRLQFQGELDPCVIRPVDGLDYLGVVMPMRI